METMYKWRKADILWYKRFIKETKLAMYCRRCDSILIDRAGRKKTKEEIWQFEVEGNVLGHTHESCCYGIEVPGIEANSADQNYGKPPTEWK